jgi:hypothetical protein
MAKKLLNCADIVARLQQVCGKTVAPRKSYAHAVDVIGFRFK